MKKIHPVLGTPLGDPRSVGNKKNNLKVRILNLLYDNTCLSIPELSKTIRLSTPTVTRAVDELVHDKMLIPMGTGSSSGGRKPGLFGLNPNARFVLGIDLSRKYVRIGIFDFNNQAVAPVRDFEFGLDTCDDVLSRIEQEVQRFLIDTGIEKKRIMGAGIAVPGLIDKKTGISYSYLQDDIPLDQQFAELLSMPAFVLNDTKVMALGELAFGLAHEKQNVLCIYLGSGVGMGMILDGKLYLGTSGFSGEFGHIQLDPQGDLCHCGKIGCLETLVSGKHMLNTVREKIENGVASSLSQKLQGSNDQLGIEDILNAALQGDSLAISSLSQTGKHLGRGLAVLVHLFNPELIILGGEMARASEYFIEEVQSSLKANTLAKIRRDARVVTSDLGRNAVLMGTVALVMQKVFAGDDME